MLNKPFMVGMVSGSLQYFNRKESVGSYHDFLDGLKDKSEMSELLSYGSFLSLSKAYLSQFLKDKKLNLAYAVRKTLHTKDRYSKSEGFTKKDEYLVVDFPENRLKVS